MRLPNPLCLVVFLLALPSAAAAATAPTKLDTLIQTTTLRLDVGDEALSGPGAEWLAAHARESRFVLLGEEHGSAGIARFARGLARLVGREGYRYTAVETDPLIAAEIEIALRKGGPDALKAWIQEDGHALAVPFYSWKEEAEFLDAALENHPTGPSAWGLDQAFIGAAYVWLEQIQSFARTPKAKAEAARLAGAAKADVMKFLGTVEIAELEALRDALVAPEEAEGRRLASLLVQSRRIYGPFVQGGGSVYAANLERETMMKTLLVDDMRAAESRDGAPPKALFKFGANHMTRGLSSTHVPSLASFVTETAVARGERAFSVLVVCGPGSSVSDFMGKTYPTDDDFAEHYGFLAGHVANPGATLIDLGPWKDRPRTWKELPPGTADLIWAYDALVVVSGAEPATFLAPKPAAAGD